MAKNEYFVIKRGSTALANKIILSGLSYQALGILLVELSLRPGTPLGYRDIVGRGAGRQAVMNAHKELEQAGLRHRFLFRTAAGELRTLVVVSDEPLASREVLDELPSRPNDFLIKIETDHVPDLPKYESKKVEGNGRQTRWSRSSTKNEALDEKENHSNIAPSANTDITAGRTVVPVMVPRSAAPQSAGAGHSPNTLRVKDYPPSPQTPNDEDHHQGEQPQGCSRRERNLIHQQETESNVSPSQQFDQTAMVELAREVLPAPMHDMGVKHLARVGAAIQQRLDAGWTCKQISAVLGSRELPTVVRNLVALVMARLRDDVPINQVPPKKNEPNSTTEWSVTLDDGRIVRRNDLYAGDLTLAWTEARRQGDPRAQHDKWEYAKAVGVERFLIHDRFRSS